MTEVEAQILKMVLELGIDRARTAVLLCGLINQASQTHRFEVVNVQTALWCIAVTATPPAEGVQP